MKFGLLGVFITSGMSIMYTLFLEMFGEGGQMDDKILFAVIGLMVFSFGALQVLTQSPFTTKRSGESKSTYVNKKRKVVVRKGSSFRWVADNDK